MKHKHHPLRLIVFGIFAMLIGYLTLPQPTFASAVVPAHNSIGTVRLSAFVVSTIVAVVVPIAVGLVTKSTLSSGLKSLILLVFNGANALIVAATMADGTAVISEQTALAFVFSVVVSIASYVGIWKPLNVTSSSPGGKLLPNVGIG